MRVVVQSPAAQGHVFALILRICAWVALCLALPPSVGAAPLFPKVSDYSVDGGPVSVAVADMDAQNQTDLITANDAGEDGPSLSFLFNTGDGRFGAEERFNLDASRYILHAIAAGDFNGDGAGDVAVAVDDLGTFPSRTTILVYRNDGAGELLQPTSYALSGFFPRCLRAGDVNGDGALDLVACHSRTEGGGGIVSVLLGQSVGGKPTGTFAAALEVSVGTSPSVATIGDADGDSRADLIIGDADEGAVFVLYGNNTPGLFDAPVRVADVDGPTAVAIVGGAAQPRIAVTSLSTATLLVFEQTSARSFSLTDPILLDQTPSDAGVADFNVDGRPDIVLASPIGMSAGIWLGTARGDFGLAESAPLTFGPTALSVTDLNHDGKPDVSICSAAGDRVSVLLDTGGIADTPTPTITASVTASSSVTKTATRTATPPKTSLPTSTPLGGATATRTVTGTLPTATITPTPTRTPTATPTSAGPGDADCNGRIDADDIGGLIFRLFNPGCATADVDTDGQVTAADLLRLIQLVADNGH